MRTKTRRSRTGGDEVKFFGCLRTNGGFVKRITSCIVAGSVLLAGCASISSGLEQFVNNSAEQWRQADGGAATTPQQNPWVGHTVQELFVRYGPPSGAFDDGNGGRILTYTAVTPTSIPGIRPQPVYVYDRLTKQWVAEPPPRPSASLTS